MYRCVDIADGRLDCCSDFRLIQGISRSPDSPLLPLRDEDEYKEAVNCDIQVPIMAR